MGEKTSFKRDVARVYDRIKSAGLDGCFNCMIEAVKGDVVLCVIDKLKKRGYNVAIFSYPYSSKDVDFSKGIELLSIDVKSFYYMIVRWEN